MLMLAGLLVSLAALTVAAPVVPSTESCDWLPWSTFNCYVFKSQNIPGAKLTVYGSDQIPIDSVYLNWALEAATTAMTVYKDFLTESLKIKLIVAPVMTGAPMDADALTIPSVWSNLCRVQVVTQVHFHAVGPNNFKRTVAHELYHCVQNSYRQLALPGLDEPSKWWMEGTAAYFGNTIYTIQQKTDWINAYDPLVPLYKAIGDGDSAAIFFQYLSNSGWQDSRINDWMTKQVIAWTDSNELSKISHETELQTAFPEFATKFLEKQIVDKNKDPIESIHVTKVLFTPWTITPTATYKFPVKVTPWKIETAGTITTTPDQIISVTFTVDDSADIGTILQYRKKPDSDWQSLESGASANIQGTSIAQCGSTEWQFLVTTTFDPSPDTFVYATVSIDVVEASTKRDSTCNPSPASPTPSPSPGNNTSTSLDRCLVGNWNLNTAAMQAYLTAELTTRSTQTVISNLLVGGAASWSITNTFGSTATFSDLTISYDGSAEGIDFQTSIGITGSVTGNLVSVGGNSSTFTWSDATSIGWANTTTAIPSLGASLPLDLSLDQQYGNQTTVQYTCAGNTLGMTGFVGKNYTWAYTWLRA